MKFILPVLMLLPLISYTQDMHVTLSAKNERLSVTLDDDNSRRTFILKTTNVGAGDYFTATVHDEDAEKEWRRTFTIHDAGDSEVAALKDMSNNSYCITLKELIGKMQAENQYYLYTVALPKDPKKAMLVRPARRLVCKIKLSDN